MLNKRLTLFAGHYGSGKTNLAINYALLLKKQGLDTVIADLDIVNPYFRTKDSEKALNAAGIQLISSVYANSGVDVPAMPPDAYSIFDRKDRYAVADVGGDDRGALALGRYAPYILEENNFEMLFVINMYRPFTRDAAGTFDIMREIENASGICFTAVVNNSNLGETTTKDDVLASCDYARKVSGMSGLPLKMTAVKEGLYAALNDRIPDLFPLRLYFKDEWVL